MPCTYNNFEVQAPCIIFLDGGSYTKNIMTEAYIRASSMDGTCYKVLYQGGYYDVEVSSIQLIIDLSWMYHNTLSPTGDWTELGHDYSGYLG